MEEKNLERIHVINEMLLELAVGNFYYRIERSSNNDEVEALIMTLNMFAEEMQNANIHQRILNSSKIPLDIAQMSFVLNQTSLIQMVNANASGILSYSNDTFIGKPFTSFLENESALKWDTVIKQFYEKNLFETSTQLKFKTKEGLSIPKTVYISLFQNLKGTENWLLLTVIHHSSYKEQLDLSLKGKIKNKAINFPNSKKNNLKQKVKLSYEDIRKIRTGHDRIVNNVEMEFPSLREFALELGTNEFKLKYGFKELYGITVHRFLIQERLRKAQMLIQYSDDSIKSIAYAVGFKSMPHFSRVFKKMFNYTPSDLRNYRNIKDDKL